MRPEHRDLTDLKSNFRHVSSEVLTRVWESNNQSWDVCFDVLNAWVASHGPVIVSVEQLEFMLDSQEWPNLPPLRTSVSAFVLPQLTARLTHLSLAQTNLGGDFETSSIASANGSVNGTSDGWSFCEDVSENEDNESDGLSSDIGEHWVQVHQVQGQGQGGRDEEVGLEEVGAAAPAPARLSFRDILLTPSPSSASSLRASHKRPRSSSGSSELEESASARTGKTGSAQMRVWRPKIVSVRLSSHQRCDVEYMDSLSVLNAPAWDHIYDEDEEDEDRGYGYGCSYGGRFSNTTSTSSNSSSKCFAQAALSNALRVRSAVRQGNNQNVKVLRCKY